MNMHLSFSYHELKIIYTETCTFCEDGTTFWLPRVKKYIKYFSWIGSNSILFILVKFPRKNFCKASTSTYCLTLTVTVTIPVSGLVASAATFSTYLTRSIASPTPILHQLETISILNIHSLTHRIPPLNNIDGSVNTSIPWYSAPKFWR